MQITINGEKELIPGEEISVSLLLKIKKVESPDMVSVQINGEIIDRASFSSTIIMENDEVEFLYFMGGG